MNGSVFIEQSSKRLHELLPEDQVKLVSSQDMCDIDAEFLGFVDIYERISEIIPTHFTIIDLGCAYNPQCFFFKEHKKYIAVDVSDCIKFKSENCVIYEMKISEFIQKHLKDFKLNETFAICSYVPSWGGDNMKLVRESFPNVFTYYPHGGYKQIVVDTGKKIVNV